MRSPEHASLPNDWRSEIHDYFLSQPDQLEVRRSYEERGLIFTNNLQMYVTRDSVVSSVDAYDYNQHAFGPIFEHVRQRNPSLWSAASRTARTRRDMAGVYLQLLQARGPDNRQAVAMKRELAFYAELKDQIYTELIETLAPALEDAGIRPVEVCI